MRTFDNRRYQWTKQPLNTPIDTPTSLIFEQAILTLSQDGYFGASLGGKTTVYSVQTHYMKILAITYLSAVSKE
jgi:hypothetical protein